MDFPPKSSKPAISGSCGELSWPTADTTYRDLYVEPSLARVDHSPEAGSNKQSSTSEPNRMLRSSWYFRATLARYLWISGWVGYSRLHLGLGSNESEYRCDHTILLCQASHIQSPEFPCLDVPSQQAPGYSLSDHVPPTRWPFSSITKLRPLLCLIMSIATVIPKGPGFFSNRKAVSRVSKDVLT